MNPLGSCPGGSAAVSGCMNGLCGAGFECINNLCCAEGARNAVVFAASGSYYSSIKPVKQNKLFLLTF